MKKQGNIGLWIRRLFMLAVGTIVSQAGIQMFVAVALGSDPYMVLVQGIAAVLHFSNGMSMNIIMVFLMAVLLISTRGYIRPGTVLCTFCVGPLVAFYESLYAWLLPAHTSFALRIGLIVIASFVASLGLAIMLQSQAGACPNDLISVVLADKLERLAFGYARIGTDAAMVLLGGVLGFMADAMVFGNMIGIGTVVSVVLYGPIIQWLTPCAQKMAQVCKVMPQASVK